MQWRFGLVVTVGDINEVSYSMSSWFSTSWMGDHSRVAYRPTVLVCNQPPRLTQPSTSSGTGNEYRQKCGERLIPLDD